MILEVLSDQGLQGALDYLSLQGVLEHQIQEVLDLPSLLEFHVSQVGLMALESLVVLVVPEDQFLAALEVLLGQAVHLVQHHLLVQVAHPSQCVLEDLEVLGNHDHLLDQVFL